MRRNPISGAAVFLILFAMPRLCLADNAEVLPKGIWKVRFEFQNSFPIKKQFDQDGNKEPIAADYNTELDGTMFPVLVDSGLDNATRFLGLGPASLGRSVVSFELELKKAELLIYYGLTDKLSVGVLIPYWWAKNDVRTALDNTSANLAINADFPVGDPILPIGIPGVNYRPFTEEDIQNILGPGLFVDGIKVFDGFGYQPVKSWSGNGVGDIEAGARYQYLNTKSWRLAVTGGVRFPTGEEDDPDNLVDYAFGDGAYALLVRLNNDYLGVPNLLLNATLKYDLILPHHQTVRVFESADFPLVPPQNRENVEIDMGDIFELETTAEYALTKAFKASLLYRYAVKPRDKVSGSLGLNYRALEEESNFTEHLYIAGLSYSTVPMFLEKKFAVPLTVSLSYRNRFAGENLLNSSYLIFGAEVFF